MSPDPEETPPVRQRNTTGSAFTFASDPPVRVEVGEVYQHPVLLDGWTALAEADQEPSPERAPVPAPEPEQAADEPQPKTKSRRAAAADTEKGGEPR